MDRRRLLTAAAAGSLSLYSIDLARGAVNISISFPGDGSALKGTVAVKITTSPLKNLQSLSFLVDGAQVASSSPVSEWTVQWDTTKVADGTHILEARAQYKQRVSIATVSVAVANSASPPPPLPPNEAVSNPTPVVTT